jgi:beta-xylosidase
MKNTRQIAVITIALFISNGREQAVEEPAVELVVLFSNPIVPGFAPDPSIVRVDNDFYLINSTFEYFPGVPVYHSTDLINWELLSYVLDDPAQAELSGIRSSDGIHASTICPSSSARSRTRAWRKSAR